jgi:CPA2 family monovalent cation:H+ antiporter-2
MGEAHQILGAIAPVVMLLALGIIAVMATRAVGLSPIVGYLVLGLGLQGAGVNLLASGTVRILAELGVVFLLFDIGLHFSLVRIRDQARDIFGFGPVQVLFGTVGLGMIGLLFGIGPLPSFLAGATLALSSTAVVAPIIAARHQQNCPVGLTATAILIFQDVAAIFILVVAGTMETGTALLPATGLALANAAAAFGIAVLLARLIVKPLFGLLARSRHEEVFTATALFVALAAGWATGSAGLSLTLGAFLGGMVIAETPYRPLIQAEIRPFRGLLLGFFFVFVGASLDVTVLALSWLTVLGLAVLLVAVKFALNAAASLIFRWSVPGSTQLAFLLAQGSEFAFVIFSLPAVRALVGEAPSAILISAVALTLAITPNLADLGRAMAGRLRQTKSPHADHELRERGQSAPVAIYGMGARGRAVADGLNAFAIRYAAIESDQKQLREAVADGYSVDFGDLSDARVWEALGMTDRRILVLTEPMYEVSRNLTPLARQHFPDVIRVAAATDEEQAARLAAIGLTPLLDREVNGEELAAGVLELLHVPSPAIAQWRDRRRERLSGSSALKRSIPLEPVHVA